MADLTRKRLGSLRHLSMLADKGNVALALLARNRCRDDLLEAGIDFCTAMIGGQLPGLESAKVSRLSHEVAILRETTPISAGTRSGASGTVELEQVRDLLRRAVAGAKDIDASDILEAQAVLLSAARPLYLADKDDSADAD